MVLYGQLECDAGLPEPLTFSEGDHAICSTRLPKAPWTLLPWAGLRQSKRHPYTAGTAGLAYRYEPTQLTLDRTQRTLRRSNAVYCDLI